MTEDGKPRWDTHSRSRPPRAPGAPFGNKASQMGDPAPTTGPAGRLGGERAPVSLSASEVKPLWVLLELLAHLQHLPGIERGETATEADGCCHLCFLEREKMGALFVPVGQRELCVTGTCTRDPGFCPDSPPLAERARWGWGSAWWLVHLWVTSCCLICVVGGIYQMNGRRTMSWFTLLACAGGIRRAEAPGSSPYQH